MRRLTNDLGERLAKNEVNAVIKAAAIVNLMRSLYLLPVNILLQSGADIFHLPVWKNFITNYNLAGSCRLGIKKNNYNLKKGRTMKCPWCASPNRGRAKLETAETHVP